MVLASTTISTSVVSCCLRCEIQNSYYTGITHKSIIAIKHVMMYSRKSRYENGILGDVNSIIIYFRLFLKEGIKF